MSVVNSEIKWKTNIGVKAMVFKPAFNIFQIYRGDQFY
jgi:hypothetical protein